VDSSPGQVKEPNCIGGGGSVMATMLASIFKARTLLFMLGSISRDPIFCSKAQILLKIFFSGH
jgi:hypothetical protein